MIAKKQVRLIEITQFRSNIRPDPVVICKKKHPDLNNIFKEWIDRIRLLHQKKSGHEKIEDNADNLTSGKRPF